MAKGKPQFAALPTRAIGDRNLTDGDFRVLASVAAYDRLSHSTGKGQGAWAAHKTMAAWIDRNYANFSTTITKLIELGYLTREPRQGDRRQFTYRVIYTDDDKVPSAKEVCPSANEQGAQRPEIVCPAHDEPGEIVCPDPSLSHDDQTLSQGEYISRREGIDTVETGKEIQEKLRDANASRGLGVKVLHRDGEPLGKTLAKFERNWKADWTQYRDNIAEWVAWLHDHANYSMEHEDPGLGYRAQRLAETVELFGWEHGLIADDALHGGGQ